MTKTTEQQWRVTMPLIQIQGHLPVKDTQRSLYRGDYLPSVVPAEEIKRLHEGGFIVRAEDFT